jgi:periplasmic protein TonB
MATVQANRNGDALTSFVVYSLLLHAAVAAFVGVRTYLDKSGDNWGGPGGSVTVGLVGNVPAIPLPQPEVQTPNQVVDDTKGLFKAEPKAPPKPEPDAVPIPKFEKNKPPKYVTRPSKVLENKVQPPPNAVPYGGGGAPSVPTSSPSFAVGPGASQGGMAFSGTGGGDFGSRFGWYVEAMNRRISQNWLQSSIDPRLTYAQRVTVQFTVLRNGTITNAQITQSSNNPTVDNSVLRAVLNSSPLDRLPPAYGGTDLNVEFWFDYKR